MIDNCLYETSSRVPYDEAVTRKTVLLVALTVALAIAAPASAAEPPTGDTVIEASQPAACSSVTCKVRVRYGGGTPHVLWGEQVPSGSSSVHYALWTGSAWAEETVTDVATGGVDPFDFAFAPDGQPIAFVVNKPSVDDIVTISAVKRSSGGTWSGAGALYSQTTSAAVVSLAADDGPGGIVVAFLDTGDSLLVAAPHNGSAFGAAEIVQSSIGALPAGLEVLVSAGGPRISAVLGTGDSVLHLYRSGSTSGPYTDQPVATEAAGTDWREVSLAEGPGGLVAVSLSEQGSYVDGLRVLEGVPGSSFADSGIIDTSGGLCGSPSCATHYDGTFAGYRSDGRLSVLTRVEDAATATEPFRVATRTSGSWSTAKVLEAVDTCCFGGALAPSGFFGSAFVARGTDGQMRRYFHQLGPSTAPPTGRTLYFPEGTTRDGFEETLWLLNRGASPMSVEVEYDFADGAAAEKKTYTVNAYGQQAVGVATEVGVNRDVSLVARSSSVDMSAARVIVVRDKQFGTVPGPVSGTTALAGVDAPRTDWSLAEGTTISGFQEYLTIQNPGDQDAEIDIDYGFEGMPGRQTHVSVPAHARATVDVNDPTQAGSGQTGVSARLRATNGQPFLVERPVYFLRDFGGGPIGGAHIAAASVPRPDWFFGEGTLLSGWYEFLTLYNPGAAPATATVDYLLEEAPQQTRTYVVQGGTRRTVQVFTAGPDEGVGRDATAAVSKGVSLKVTATSDVVAERPMYAAANQGSDAVILDGHDAVGSAGPTACSTFPVWFASEPSRSYLTLANNGSAPVTVDLRVLDGDPAHRSPVPVAVPEKARKTVYLNDLPTQGSSAGLEVTGQNGAAVIAELPFYLGTGPGPGGRTVLGASVLQATPC